MEALTTSDAAPAVENGSPRLDTSVRLAYERTRVAYDRTVMAAIRTATSLITFGFTVYKFFQLEQQAGKYKGQLIGPRAFGMILISIGLLSLLSASLEYRRNINMMLKTCPDMERSRVGKIAIFIALLGILSLLGVIFQQ